MNCSKHTGHVHRHGSDCGHVAVKHEGHVDYLQDGRLHHVHDDHVDRHVLEITEHNPDVCTPQHECSAHEASHVHGPGCGHEPVPHGDHVDYLVEGHLHYPHGDHCDDHGQVDIVRE